MALSFPVSPTLNQTYTVGTKTWKWNGSAWDIVAATGVSVDSTARASAAAADGLATAAYGYANTLPTVTYVNNAVANVVNSAPSTLDTLKELADALGSDVNFSTTVATNIGNVNNKSNAAYQHANNAFDAANAATTLIAGVNSYQNTTITAVSNYATSGYGMANAANELASAAFTAANNGTGASFAYTQANASNQLAQSAYNHANNAYNYANTLSSGTSAVDAMNRANDAIILANSAYGKANAALANTTGTFAGDLTVTGNIAVNLVTGSSANTVIKSGIYSTTFDNTGVINLSGPIRFADGSTQNTAGGGSGTGITYTANSTPPDLPNKGDKWYSTTEDILYEYTYDGTSYFWLDVSSATVSSSSFLTQNINPLLLTGM